MQNAKSCLDKLHKQRGRERVDCRREMRQKCKRNAKPKQVRRPRSCEKKKDKEINSGNYKRSQRMRK